MITLWMAVLSLTAATLALAEAPGASPSCRRKCGDMDIPYPFGLNGDDSSCYRTWPLHFNLTCNETFSRPKVFRGDFEVSSLSLFPPEARFLTEVSYRCYNSTGHVTGRHTWDITLSTFIIDHRKNVFTGVGCDTVAMIDGPDFTSGCISSCYYRSSAVEGACSGIGCCKAAVPKGLRSYQTRFGSRTHDRRVTDFNRCSYSFLVEDGNYTFHTSDLEDMKNTTSFPVVVNWVVDNRTCAEARTNMSSYACISNNSICLDWDYGYVCNCSQGFQGNAYISDDCRDIDECAHPGTYPCFGTCRNTIGSYTCECPTGEEEDPRVLGGCRPVSSKSTRPFPTAVVVPVSVASTILVIVLSFWLSSILQKRRLNKMKERWFLQNGGEKLQRKIYSSGRSEDIFKIFSKEEIEKATNKFDQALVLGHGGQGVVYKGKLPNDNRTFAIKKSKVVDGKKIDEFINELVILSKIRHRNIVKLVGCCLEDEQPLLVYEFIENGTLSKHIKSGSLSWESRLKIASEAANAFAYLHTSIEIPIIHGDVKSSNILLDKQINAKVSDFGASKSVPIDETQIQTMVMGTLGYLDPEYMHTHQLTSKSDVYSFGVVLVELLTGRAPLSYERSEGEKCLAMHFMSCMRTNNLERILDMRIYDVMIGEQMKEVASIARRCLNMAGDNRPLMKEVANELERLQAHTCNIRGHGSGEEVNSLLNESHIATHTNLLATYHDYGETFSRTIEESSLINFEIESGR